jgi:hypothetical protein
VKERDHLESQDVDGTTLRALFPEPVCGAIKSGADPSGRAV